MGSGLTLSRGVQKSLCGGKEVSLPDRCLSKCQFFLAGVWRQVRQRPHLRQVRQSPCMAFLLHRSLSLSLCLHQISAGWHAGYSSYWRPWSPSPCCACAWRASGTCAVVICARAPATSAPRRCAPSGGSTGQSAGRKTRINSHTSTR